MLTVRSIINIASQTVPPIIPVVQGDTGRAILFTLADFTIPAGATATYYVQKPSGEAVYNNATIDGNNVLVNLTAQSIIEKGDNYGQVRIAVGEDVVTSFDFILLVKEFRGIDAVQSLTEMNIFDKAVEQAADAIDEVKTDALDDIGDAKEEAIEEVTSNFDLKLDTSSTKGVQNQVITQAINTVNNAIGDLSGETVTPTATNNYGVGGNVGQVIETWATTEYWHGIYTVSAGNTYVITTVSDFPQQLVVWFTNASNTIIENHKAFATDHVEMVCTAPTGATKLFVMSYGYDAYHGTVQKVEPLSETVSNLKEDLSKLGYTNEVSPNWETKKRIGETGQIINSGDAFAISDFIQVNPNEITTVDGVHSYTQVSMPSVHLYNSEKTHVGFIYANGYTDITSDVLTNNASYIRLSQYITNDYPLASVVVYETVRGSIDELKDSVNSIESSVETLSNNVSVQMSQQYVNVLTGYTASQNEKYLSDQGQLIDNPNWASLTDYVPVDAEASYGLRFAEQFIEWKNCKFCYYDASKQYLTNETHANNQTYTTPADCAYLRISTTNLNYDEKGHNDFSTAYLEKSTDGTTAVVVENQNYYTGTFPRTGLAGIKWALFGDSITEHNNRSGANYDDYIRAETGIITINEGVGGSGYKNRDDNNNAFYQIALKTASEWVDADIITVAGGVNDMWGAIGTYGLGSPDDVFSIPADITGGTENTIMACFNYMLECLINNAPNARIGVISPIPCYTTQNGTLYAEVPYDPECNMEKFVDACKKSCALHGIPYLDLFHNSGLRPWDSNFNAKYFKTISADSPDGLHPNELGQKWFYPMVREFLKTLK